MKATEFEFRHRSVVSLIHFWLGFQAYSIDRVNVVWAVVPWDTPRGALLARLIFAVGTLLVGLAAGIRTWAASYLRSDVVHDPKLHSETLVADGPYRHVRNPLYLGMLLLCVGIGFLASRLGFAILALVATIRVVRLIGREESALEKQQGESFREYCRRVPRLLPSVYPHVPAAGLEPRWAQAFRGEASMWGFFVTMLGFTVTLQDNIAWALAGAAALVWLLQKVGQRRARTAQA